MLYTDSSLPHKWQCGMRRKLMFFSARSGLSTGNGSVAVTSNAAAAIVLSCSASYKAFFINHTATRCIYQNRCRFHFRKALPVNQVTGLLCEWRMKANYIRLRVNRVYICEFYSKLHSLLIIRKYHTPETYSQIHSECYKLLSDIAKSNQANCSCRQLMAVCIRLPNPICHTTIIVYGSPQRRQNHCGSHFCNGIPFAPGVFDTTTPCRVAALRSIASSPTPLFLRCTSNLEDRKYGIIIRFCTGNHRRTVRRLFLQAIQIHSCQICLLCLDSLGMEHIQHLRNIQAISIYNQYFFFKTLHLSFYSLMALYCNSPVI